jgi:hypothetical protein
MEAFHFHHPGSQAYRLHYRMARGHWNERDQTGLRTGLVLGGIGLFLLSAFTLALAQNIAGGADALLLFCGAPFFLFGGLLLALDATGLAIRRVRRVKQHCGRCRFYQPLEGQYERGVCLSDPRETPVQRTYGCSFFHYSERAWARERFAQRVEALKHAGSPGD